MIPIAHAGHWLASLLYIVPIVLVVGKGDAPPAPPESA